MMRDFILGTAGHIDHGKTALVKALTGIDCDRLPEEKSRGITIDLGFAHLRVGEFHFGIVDVPGHERFIRNMLAGATGIDLALLVVSAVESVKLQTREHLEILQLLGVQRGVIALTKCDAVDEDSRRVVELEIAELVKGTFLESAPIISTSAATGFGIEELKAALLEVARGIETAPAGPFRLAIDRAFAVPGHGTVVTGTVASGEVRIGDEIEWFREDGTREMVRVRGINNHNRKVETAYHGQRAAINLAGVALADVHRGQGLASPGFLVPSHVLTVEMHVPPSSARGIKHRLPVRLHLGTAEIVATVSLLDADALAPGQSGFGQLFLDQSATAVWGQHFVIRDSSAEETLGGGCVLQPTAAKIRRRHLEQLERVEQLASAAPRVRAEAWLWFAGYAGLRIEDSWRVIGIRKNELEELLRERACAEIETGSGMRFIHSQRIAELEARILGELAVLHAEHPLMTNHDTAAVLARLNYIGDLPLLHAVAARMRRTKLIVGDAKRIAHADFQPKLSAALRKLKDKIVEAHRVAGFQPPEPGSFANAAGGNAGSLGDVYEVACAEGHLVRVDADFYLHSDAVAEMKEKVVERLKSGGATMAELRDLLGTTRKYAIPICEYLDRTRVTVRNGDVRELAELKS